VFYCWLFLGITVINEESFEKFLDPDRDADCRKNLVDCLFGYTPSSKKLSGIIFKIPKYGP